MLLLLLLCQIAPARAYYFWWQPCDPIAPCLVMSTKPCWRSPNQTESASINLRRGKKCHRFREGFIKKHVPIDPVPGPDSGPTKGEDSDPDPTVCALHLCMSHWFGPSAIGRNREIAASLAILGSFPGASAVGCGAQLDISSLLKPSEKASIAA
jgi:hypothetical protein